MRKVKYVFVTQQISIYSQLIAKSRNLVQVRDVTLDHLRTWNAPADSSTTATRPNNGSPLVEKHIAGVRHHIGHFGTAFDLQNSMGKRKYIFVLETKLQRKDWL